MELKKFMQYGQAVLVLAVAVALTACGSNKSSSSSGSNLHGGGGGVYQNPYTNTNDSGYLADNYIRSLLRISAASPADMSRANDAN